MSFIDLHCIALGFNVSKAQFSEKKSQYRFLACILFEFFTEFIGWVDMEKKTKLAAAILTSALMAPLALAQAPANA
ncbi:MAG: hypothetical protein ACPG65_05450, partial [Porticoccaceae bacterium]